MSDLPQLSRFIIGIDLGTTNSSVAYVDTAEANWRVRDFLVPQVVAPNVIEGRETVPSFYYEAGEGEFAEGALDLPWGERGRRDVVGVFARDHGAAVTGRLISSAKSWLSHAGVDRTAALLPWHGAGHVTKLSPVEVSARYLAHVRGAWDHQHPGHPMSGQEVVLTVPASFDEVARELTVEAAKRAGLVKLTLVEEPQAAFYAWIHLQGERWETQVAAGQTILVADVGGGTTDLTLIRVRRAENGKVMFHRVAVGEHLILGGDNLDLALAHHVEQKVTAGGKLGVGQWGPLLRACRNVKETMLGADAPERMMMNVAAGGSKLIGGARQVEVTRREVMELLVEGFLPRVPLDARPMTRRSGFQEFGLPYAADAAITKYLAAFLSAHGEKTGDVAIPDVLLFNGGFFASPVLRERFLEVLSSWFGRAPVVLENDRLDLAVSCGAAYYGMVRRGKGVRITGGLAHSYYIGVEAGAEQPSALCLLPAGVEEGHDVQLEQRFNLLIRKPVEFPLYVSATRTTDPAGTLVAVEAEQLTALPPIRTVLHSGKKSAADSVAVNLHARLSEIGTLELWAQEIKGDRRWTLQFDVRSATRAEVGRHTGVAETGGVVEASVVEPASQLIRSSFTKAGQPAPAALVKRLEEATRMARNDWPASLMRAMWEVLMEVQEARRISMEHEIRWLNLTGFCLRPGYGLAVDDWRVGQLWRLFAQKLAYPRNEQVRGEWWVLWRRVAGGLSAGQQTTLAEPLVAAMKSRLRAAGAINQHKDAPFQYGPHESAEVWRVVGSLELLRVQQKVELAQTILELLPREKPAATVNAAMFALGRLGSRVPVYGPLNVIVGVDVVEEWVGRLMVLIETAKVAVEKGEMLFPLVQMTRRTGDRYRDVGEDVRGRVGSILEAQGAPAHYVQLVREGGELAAEEQKLTFGEALPRGLSIE